MSEQCRHCGSDDGSHAAGCRTAERVRVREERDHYRETALSAQSRVAELETALQGRTVSCVCGAGARVAELEAEIKEARNEAAAVRRAYLHERNRANDAVGWLRGYDPTLADDLAEMAYKEYRTPASVGGAEAKPCPHAWSEGDRCMNCGADIRSRADREADEMVRQRTSDACSYCGHVPPDHRDDCKVTFEADRLRVEAMLRGGPRYMAPEQRPNEARPGPRWTVSAYLVRDEHVLLVRHKKLRMWLPIGGGIEEGERPAEAVLREVREETGFAIKGIDCLGFDEHYTGERIHMNLAHRADVMTMGEPKSDGSWDEHLWLRIGAEPPQGAPNNVRDALLKLVPRPDEAKLKKGDPVEVTVMGTVANDPTSDHVMVWIHGIGDMLFRADQVRPAFQPRPETPRPATGPEIDEWYDAGRKRGRDEALDEAASLADGDARYWLAKTIRDLKTSPTGGGAR